MTTWHEEPQAPAPAPLPNPRAGAGHTDPGRRHDCCGQRAADRYHLRGVRRSGGAFGALPPRTTPLSGAEWRDQVKRAQAAYGRGQRGGRHRRRAARGTLPGPGMIRRPPPGDDAA